MSLYLYVIQFILFKQKQWANLCFQNGVEKSDLFIKTLLIFESAKYFLKYFAEIYAKETRENAGAKYSKFHTTKPAVMVQTIQDGDVSYKSRLLTLANMVCSGSGCIL